MAEVADSGDDIQLSATALLNATKKHWICLRLQRWTESGAYYALMSKLHLDETGLEWSVYSYSPHY